MNKGSQDKTSKEERNMCYNLEDEKNNNNKIKYK